MQLAEGKADLDAIPRAPAKTAAAKRTAKSAAEKAEDAN